MVVGEGPVRTGVTAIFPFGRARPNAAAFAGWFSMSGNGEMTGMAFVEERGRFDPHHPDQHPQLRPGP